MIILSKIKKYLKSWWNRHICAELSPDEDFEFSEKYRK